VSTRRILNLMGMWYSSLEANRNLRADRGAGTEEGKQSFCVRIVTRARNKCDGSGQTNQRRQLSFQTHIFFLVSFEFEK